MIALRITRSFWTMLGHSARPPNRPPAAGVQRYVATVPSAVPSRPWGSFAAIFAALLYGASPLDVIPDLIPLLGWSDDAAFAATMGLLALRLYLGWRAKQRAALARFAPNRP
jgi:uncharacterized membrane protein YkvA (DUF1232 family)